MRFSGAARPHQQESRVGAGRIIAGECLGYQLRLFQAAVPCGPIGAGVIKVLVEIVEIAMFVARGNTRAPDRSRIAILARAIAWHGPDTLCCAGPRLSGGQALNRLFPRAAWQFFFFRDAVDGLPSRSAAHRAIRLRHVASIGARLKLRKLSRAVESIRGVEKMKPQMNTDKH